MTAARNIDVDALTDDEIDQLAKRLRARARAKRLARDTASDVPVSDLDRALVRKKAREWGLVVRERKR